jgi:hypothetical protein
VKIILNNVRRYVISKNVVKYQLQNVKVENVRVCSYKIDLLIIWPHTDQGCRIFRATTYQNGENIPKYVKIHQKAVKYARLP